MTNTLITCKIFFILGNPVASWTFPLYVLATGTSNNIFKTHKYSFLDVVLLYSPVLLVAQPFIMSPKVEIRMSLLTPLLLHVVNHQNLLILILLLFLLLSCYLSIGSGSYSHAEYYILIISSLDSCAVVRFLSKPSQMLFICHFLLRPCLIVMALYDLALS